MEVNYMLQNMSTVDNKGNVDISVCANCGKEGDNIKACTACKLVKYCNRECQIAHRPQHKKECRKRAAELHDEELFKQPPPQYGDCPICFLRLPFVMVSGWRYFGCCGKVICSGCCYAPVYDDQGNEVDEKCPFCRTPLPTSQEEAIEREKKRVDAEDPIAIFNLGMYYKDGRNGFPQDMNKALELLHRAGELGSAEAYTNIGYSYHNGVGVEVDTKKARHYYELAAMKGDAAARFNLGNDEWRAGNKERAFKHWMIAARDGYSNSLNNIKDLYTNGHITKEDYAEALQSYQTYLGEIKSVQRDKATAFSDTFRYY